MYEIYLTVVTSPLFWLSVGLLAVMLILKSVQPPDPSRIVGLAPRFSDKSGLNALGWFAIILAPIWFALLLATIWTLYGLWLSPPGNDDPLANRLHYIAIVGLMTALAGLVGTPLALIRVFTNERQTTAAEEGLVTDRITKAVAGLGAEKEVNRLGRQITVLHPDAETPVTVFEWEDARYTEPKGATRTKEGDWQNVPLTRPNLEVRIGSIFALERISTDSPRDHVQIMEILCAYIRENSPAEDAEDFPEPEWQPLADDADAAARAAHLTARKERLGNFYLMSKAYRWAQGLKTRTDIEIAIRVIGRRTVDQVRTEGFDRRHSIDGYQLDLRNCSLQGCDLNQLDLRNALLAQARLEGATLIEARMEGAILSAARMEGANLRDARMEGADLDDTRMEGANLSNARMRGANLLQARMEGANLWQVQMERTRLFGARMEGGYFWEAQMEGANLREARMQGAHLRQAQMQRADLRDTQMQGADLSKAQLQGADLSEARFDEKTGFSDAAVQFAAMKHGNYDRITLSQTQLNSLFGDRSVILPESLTRPAHWPTEDLDWFDFRKKWRAWQVSQGYTPHPQAD